MTIRKAEMRGRNSRVIEDAWVLAVTNGEKQCVCVWHYVAIHCVGCGSVPVREFLCMLWRETHTKARALRKGRSERRQRWIDKRNLERAVDNGVQGTNGQCFIQEKYDSWIYMLFFIFECIFNFSFKTE